MNRGSLHKSRTEHQKTRLIGLGAVLHEEDRRRWQAFPTARAVRMLTDGESVENISRQILRLGVQPIFRQFYLEIVHLMNRHHRIEPVWHRIHRILPGCRRRSRRPA